VCAEPGHVDSIRKYVKPNMRFILIDTTGHKVPEKNEIRFKTFKEKKKQHRLWKQ